MEGDPYKKFFQESEITPVFTTALLNLRNEYHRTNVKQMAKDE